jgi:P4 family phage/plasmid primase-like protien
MTDYENPTNKDSSLAEQNYNEGVNFWRYDVGVPTIPGIFRSKRPAVPWEGYQENPPTDEQHKQWLNSGAYSGGIMVFCGAVRYRKDREGLYLVGLDFDKQKAIDEFCTRDGKTASLQELAEKFLVEQHDDSPDKAHVFFYAPFRYPVKRPDNIIGIEVKSSPRDGLMRVTPSMTEKGIPLKIIGATDPPVLSQQEATEVLQHLNHICINSGVEYLDKKGANGSASGNSSYITPALREVIKSLRIPFDNKDGIKIPGGYRNVTLLSVADSILLSYLRRDKANEERLREFFFAINHFLCDPQLPVGEVESIWASASKWAYPKILEREFEDSKIGGKEDERQLLKKKKEKEERQGKLQDLKNELECKYYFKTLKDTEEIWYYDEARGVYVSNGEVIIKASLESAVGPELTNNDVNEFLGHIQRSSYFDIEWIGCADRMLNLRTGQTVPFSPEFLNTVRIPVKYSDGYATGLAADFFRLVERRNFYFVNCQFPKIMKFLYDIVEPDDVELLLDFMAYCLWRDYKYANWLLFNGYGHNGKSILLNLIEKFLGKENTSSESLERLLNERFAPASLYQKLANIDADVSGDILIKNTGVIKKLTGNDESPGEFKYKTPFKFRNFAKLIFSCNEIPKTDDTTDAYFRRLIIINFTRQFLAEKDDPHILDKIATEEEFSGLLHELLGRLPRIIRQGIRPTTNETMAETYEKYIRSTNPVGYFCEQALTFVDATGKRISKQQMYESYSLFCSAKKIAPESEWSFSRELTSMGYEYKQFKKDGKKISCWVNVGLREWKAIEDKEQQTLPELTENDTN